MTPNNCKESSKPENPNELLAIPEWINAKYFRPIIEKQVPDFVSIKNFNAVAANKPGESYMSIMIRALVDIELKDDRQEQISYIVKTPLAMDKMGTNMFCKENQMYQLHIPNFKRLYREAGVDIELAPNCVHIDESPEGITLLLEDLKRQNFVNVDRLKGFDMEQMRRVLHKVAELHAASAVFQEQNGAYDRIYSQTIFEEANREMLEGMIAVRNAQYVRAMREWQLPDEEYYISTVLTPKEYYNKGCKLNSVDEHEFNCLNHGDLWCNNIMFSGNRTLFVDFQAGKWGSPALDLWYLIVTSASLDIKIKEFDHFIQIYHTRLVECLQLLKYSKPIPTLRNLHIMMIKYGDWGPLLALVPLVGVLMPSNRDSNLDMALAAGSESDAHRYKTFVNPYYVQAMLQLYPFHRNKGII